MKLVDSICFPFKGPRKWSNIGLLAVCNLIPVIGPLVVMGYGVIVEKELIRNINADAPQFDFGNFSKYLERGVAPFVVGLIAAVVLVPIAWALMIVAFIIAAIGKDSPVVVGLAIAGLVVIGFAMTLGLLLFIFPMTLRASLLGKIGPAFDFRWTLDFIRRVGGRMLLSVFLLQLLTFPLLIGGMCVIYVGVFAAAAIVNMMMWHLLIQLYHLYVDRGGTPLVVPDEPMLPAFPVGPSGGGGAALSGPPVPPRGPEGRG